MCSSLRLYISSSLTLLVLVFVLLSAAMGTSTSIVKPPIPTIHHEFVQQMDVSLTMSPVCEIILAGDGISSVTAITIDAQTNKLLMFDPEFSTWTTSTTPAIYNISMTSASSLAMYGRFCVFSYGGCVSDAGVDGTDVWSVDVESLTVSKVLNDRNSKNNNNTNNTNNGSITNTLSNQVRTHHTQVTLVDVNSTFVLIAGGIDSNSNRIASIIIVYMSSSLASEDNNATNATNSNMLQSSSLQFDSSPLTTPTLQQARSHMCGITFDGVVLFVGGFSVDGATDSVDICSRNPNVTSSVHGVLCESGENLPDSRGALACTQSNNVGYFSGGSKGCLTKLESTIFTFDATTYQWRTLKTTMSVGRMSHFMSVLISPAMTPTVTSVASPSINYTMILLGLGQESNTIDVLLVDHVTNRTRLMALDARMQRTNPVVVALNDKIFIYGGDGDRVGNNDHDDYPTINTDTLTIVSIDETLTWKGAWDSTQWYTVNDVVTYNGASYVRSAIMNNEINTIDELDTDTTQWVPMNSHGVTGATGGVGVTGAQGNALTLFIVYVHVYT